jgi:hypothetical protein
MNDRIFALFLPAVMAVLIMTLACGAHAQNGAEQLRQRNEQLEAKLADLQSALDAARTRIATLEAQIASGSSSLAKTTPSQTTPPPDTKATDALDLSNPVSAESAIRNAYRTDYQASGLPEFSSKEWAESEVMYERWLKKWIAAIDRKFRKPVSWTVVMERSFRANRTESMATLVAWNPEENAQVGTPFQVRIPTRTLERIYRAMRIAGGTVELTLNGVYVPALQFNRNRINRGPFDNPPFIGPMTELRWSVDVKSLSPPTGKADDSEEAQ